MVIQQFEHNQKACQAAEEMLERCGKENVVHLNGTCKRGITFKPANAHPGASFLWLSPGAIYKQQIPWALTLRGKRAGTADPGHGLGAGLRTGRSVPRYDIPPQYKTN